MNGTFFKNLSNLTISVMCSTFFWTYQTLLQLQLHSFQGTKTAIPPPTKQHKKL